MTNMLQYSRSNAWMTTLLRASIAETPVLDDHPKYTLEELYDIILNCLKKRLPRTAAFISSPPEKLYSVKKPVAVLPKMTPGDHSTCRYCGRRAVAVAIRYSSCYSCMTHQICLKPLEANVGHQRPSGPAYTRRHR